MKKVLIIHDSYILKLGLTSLIGEMAIVYEKEFIGKDDNIAKAINSKSYDLICFCLIKSKIENLQFFWEVVKKNKDTTGFIVFLDTMEFALQKSIYFAGVKALVYLWASLNEISRAFEDALNNRIYLSSSLLEKLINEKKEPGLTSREAEIAVLLAAGKSNRFIGERLDLRPSTVSTFKKKIFIKLEIDNMLDLQHIMKRGR